MADDGSRMEQQRILVVEDNIDILVLVSRILSADGYHIFSASNLDDAIAILTANRIDLVLLDIVLPGKSGLDILTEMRMGSNKKLHDIPVMMITSKSSVKDIDFALALGADAYLVKPFRGQTLREKVRTIIEELVNA